MDNSIVAYYQTPQSVDFISLIMARFSTYLMNHWEERHKAFQSISPAPAEKALQRQDALHRACLHQRRAVRITLKWMAASRGKKKIALIAADLGVAFDAQGFHSSPSYVPAIDRDAPKWVRLSSQTSPIKKPQATFLFRIFLFTFQASPRCDPKQSSVPYVHLSAEDIHRS